MRLLRNVAVQFLLVIALGFGLASWWSANRAREAEWQRTHFRRGEQFTLRSTDLYARTPFLIDREGREWTMPMDESTHAIDWRDAVWFTLERTGQLRYFNEARDEVTPTVRVID